MKKITINFNKDAFVNDTINFANQVIDDYAIIACKIGLIEWKVAELAVAKSIELMNNLVKA